MAVRKEREPDPPAQVRELARAIAAGGLGHGYALRGEERYFREQALAIVLDAARARGLEIAKHDVDDPDFHLGALLDDLSAAPMFAAARCVVVRNAGALLKKEDREDSILTRALIAFIGDAHGEGSIVVDSDSLRADHALVKAIVKQGGVLFSSRRLWDSPPPWNPDPSKTEVVQWLQDRARTAKIALGANDATYIVAATGNDLFALDGALERLRQRGQPGVRAIVGWTSGASPYQVAEELCRGDLPRSLAGIEVLFSNGFQGRDGEREIDPSAVLAVLFGSLRNKLRQTLAGALALERGGDVEAAIASAGIATHPKARAEFEARLHARSPAQWRAMTDDLVELERRSRTGGTVDANDLAWLALRWKRVGKDSLARR